MWTTERRRSRMPVLLLGLLLPLTAGCPQLQNEAVSVIDNATREFIDNMLDQFFDQLRSDEI